MPVHPLHRIIVSNDEDGTQVTRLPNSQEMMDKINEIVHFVNRLETSKANKSEANPFKPRITR